MRIREALKGQYHAGLAMLRACIESCPDDLWLEGKHPRNFWRIAYHAIFYTHLYLQTCEDAFVPWEKQRDTVRILWDDEEPVPVEPQYTREEMLEYVELVDSGVDGWVDVLDLESTDPGFHWYSIPKLDHQILNVRHLGGHVGQLSELLMARGIDVDWVSKR